MKNKIKNCKKETEREYFRPIKKIHKEGKEEEKHK